MNNEMFVAGEKLYKTIEKNLSNCIVEYQSVLIFLLSREYFVLWHMYVLDGVIIIQTDA